MQRRQRIAFLMFSFLTISIVVSGVFSRDVSRGVQEAFSAQALSAPALFFSKPASISGLPQIWNRWIAVLRGPKKTRPIAPRVEDFLIRPAEGADVENIIQLVSRILDRDLEAREAQNLLQQLRKTRRPKDGFFLIAFSGDQMIGLCSAISVDPGVYRLGDLGVVPGYRALGVAKALVSERMRWLIEKTDAQFVYGYSLKDSISAALFEQMECTPRRIDGKWMFGRQLPRRWRLSDLIFQRQT